MTTNITTEDNELSINTNAIEQIIQDHNKAMRTDMASEIVGGTRSKAITDVITVKAIKSLIKSEVAKAELALIDRLEEQGLQYIDAAIGSAIHFCKVIPLSAITNERNKLKGKK